jgi:hypothetical protein
MIHVFCSRGSEGARDLIEAIRLKGTIARRRRKGKPFLVSDEDLIVCWGETFKKLPNHARVLNGSPVFSKYEELAILRDKGVRTPEFSLKKQKSDWLARRTNHQGGSDLLHPSSVGQYYVQKVPTTKEFRVHVFKGMVIRLGMKVPRENFPNPHPWIRAYDAGWKLSYGNDCQENVPSGVRSIAKKAVEALELDFGAVDVGAGPGGPWVFEVNKAPGLEGRTVEVYAEKLIALHGAL